MTSIGPGTRRWWVWTLGALAAVVVAAYLVWTLPGVHPRTGFSVPLDAVLPSAGYLLVAGLAILGVAMRAPRSTTWWLVASAVTLRAAGSVIDLVMIARDRPMTFPSFADLLWVLSSLVLIAAVGFRVRELAPRLSLLTVLDGIGGAFLAVGVLIAVLTGPGGALVDAALDGQALTGYVAYPILDAALLVAAGSLALAVRRRIQRADLVLLVGVVLVVVVDLVHLVRLAEGTARTGTLSASLFLAATGLVAATVWRPPTPRPQAEGRFGDSPTPTVSAGIALPATTASLAVLGLAWAGHLDGAQIGQLPFLAAALVAIGRSAATVRHDRAERSAALDVAELEIRRFHALVEASTDFIGIADQRGNILYLNPGARRMLGVSNDQDITGWTVPKTLPGTGDARVEMRWSQLLADGVWHGESIIGPLDGSWPAVPVAVSSFLVQEAGTQHPFVVATIQRDISQQRLAETAMRDLADQRARLVNRLVQAQEEERSRIAADVHDDSVQVLAAVDLRLGLLRRRLAKDAPDVLDTIDAVHQTVSDASERLRNLLFDLESPAREGGLAAALTEAAAYVFNDTDVRWRITGDTGLDLPEGQRITAYRIAKEAMVNARKHADASRVVIDLGTTTGDVVLTISDDGRGIEDELLRPRPGHLGLASIHDRAATIGGRVEVRRRVEGGTEVRVVLPTPDPVI